jgi:hypothetical protein
MADENDSSRLANLIENFIPVTSDPMLKNYHPTGPAKPAINPMAPPPFAIGGPAGKQPEGGSGGSQDKPGGGSQEKV